LAMVLFLLIAAAVGCSGRAVYQKWIK
jgi:hypothetical protein